MVKIDDSWNFHFKKDDDDDDDAVLCDDSMSRLMEIFFYTLKKPLSTLHRA